MTPPTRLSRISVSGRRLLLRCSRIALTGCKSNRTRRLSRREAGPPAPARRSRNREYEKRWKYRDHDGQPPQPGQNGQVVTTTVTTQGTTASGAQSKAGAHRALQPAQDKRAAAQPAHSAKPPPPAHPRSTWPRGLRWRSNRSRISGKGHAGGSRLRKWWSRCRMGMARVVIRRVCGECAWGMLSTSGGHVKGASNLENCD